MPSNPPRKKKSSSQRSFNYTLWNLCVSFCEDEKCFSCSSGGLPAFFTRAGHLLLVPTHKMRKLLNKNTHKTTPSSINKTQENTEVLGKILYSWPWYEYLSLQKEHIPKNSNFFPQASRRRQMSSSHLAKTHLICYFGREKERKLFKTNFSG